MSDKIGFHAIRASTTDSSTSDYGVEKLLHDLREDKHVLQQIHEEAKLEILTLKDFEKHVKQLIKFVDFIVEKQTHVKKITTEILFLHRRLDRSNAKHILDLFRSFSQEDQEIGNALESLSKRISSLIISQGERLVHSFDAQTSYVTRLREDLEKAYHTLHVGLKSTNALKPDLQTIHTDVLRVYEQARHNDEVLPIKGFAEKK